MKPVANCKDLAEWREWGLGIFQADVAERAECSQTTVSEIETGKRRIKPRSKMFRKIQKALELTAYENEFIRLVQESQRLDGVRQAEKALRTPAEPRLPYGSGVVIQGPDGQLVRKAEGGSV